MNNRKTKSGVVLSNKMDKTVTVRVSRRIKHPRYGKVITRWKKYYAHTDKQLEVGQEVTIEETRPLSKLKHWRVVK
ncbi:MAG: 30S ribosomal protein S17 [Simkaniaceae bacterium]|nr:30S ribosomal protein S17 [Simkaniaceae bacterium]